MPVNQKGANGIIAEYKSASQLNLALANAGIRITAQQSELDDELRDAMTRVGNELTGEQLARALRQGVALGDYLFECITQSPAQLGLADDMTTSQYSVHVDPVGSKTNSGDPADLRLTFTGADTIELPVSLKAYHGPQSSLGSKSGRASLGRLFMKTEKVKETDFVKFFGAPASAYQQQISLFNATADEFYASDASKQFLDEYQARKGTRKPNNPRRRKEVGDYFTAKHGFVSEHKLADLYVDCYDAGVSKIHGDATAQREFVTSLRFLLGNPEILVLNAEDGDGNIKIVNSLTNDTYRSLNQVLRDGLSMQLTKRASSSVIGVGVTNGSASCDKLSLAMWKDGTIQFKLDTSSDS